MTKLWVVRAGAKGERESDALIQGKLLPGFQAVGDLTNLDNRDEILRHLQEALPNEGKNTLGNFAAQLNQFANKIKVNDLVVMPRKQTNGVAIGIVTGDYQFDAENGYRHSRTVDWKEESLPRDSFKQDLRHSFGAYMTICQVQRNAALERVQHVLEDEGRCDPGPPLEGKRRQERLGTVMDEANDYETEDRDDETKSDDYEVDIEDVASQQIISLIKSEFAGHALANLVAEILRARGYITKVSPPGPDKGVDILATDDAIGLGEKRICVQVKSGDAPVGDPVVTSLLGAVERTRANTGILVSIGGVTKEAQKEFNNSFFKLRLWQMEDLLKELFLTYKDLSDETRAKIPLKQIWVPIPEETS